MNGARRGFTLVEVIVALVVTTPGVSEMTWPVKLTLCPTSAVCGAAVRVTMGCWPDGVTVTVVVARPVRPVVSVTDSVAM